MTNTENLPRLCFLTKWGINWQRWQWKECEKLKKNEVFSFDSELRRNSMDLTCYSQMPCGLNNASDP